MQRTPNYNLPQFEPTDKYTLEDYNTAYQIIDNILKQNNDGVTDWNTFKASGGTFGGKVGFPGILDPTTDKTMIVEGRQFIVGTSSDAKELGLGFRKNDGSLGRIWLGLSTSTNELTLRPESALKNSIALGTSGFPWRDAYLGSFSNSTDGYTKLPNGLILQWGTIPSALISVNGSIGVQVTLPITFPTTILNVNACCTYNLRTSNATDISKINCTVNLRSTSQIDVYGEDVKGITTAGNFEIKWHAIGY